MVFILVGFLTINWNSVKPVFDSIHNSGILNASIIFFLSYMGFGLITNASENMKHPRRNVPRAIYISIFIVMIFYILISLVTIGNLSLAQIIKSNENALAIAAKPFLGSFGFILISLGALFSISSALNATIYGGANIAYALAKDGELPENLERKIWFKSTEGLYFTAGIGLVLALFLNLSSIAIITSSVYTVIYLFVLISHFRLTKKYGGNKVLLGFNILVLLGILIALLRYQWLIQKSTFFIIIVVFISAIVLEYIFRKYKNKSFLKMFHGL